jgi:hypothetical protein
MSWSGAYITAGCDNPDCRTTYEFELTETAHGWDDRYLDDELEGHEWVKTDSGIYCCPECAETVTEAA